MILRFMKESGIEQEWPAPLIDQVYRSLKEGESPTMISNRFMLSQRTVNSLYRYLKRKGEKLMNELYMSYVIKGSDGTFTCSAITYILPYDFRDKETYNLVLKRNLSAWEEILKSRGIKLLRYVWGWRADTFPFQPQPFLDVKSQNYLFVNWSHNCEEKCGIWLENGDPGNIRKDNSNIDNYLDYHCENEEQNQRVVYLDWDIPFDKGKVSRRLKRRLELVSRVTGENKVAVYVRSSASMRTHVKLVFMKPISMEQFFMVRAFLLDDPDRILSDLMHYGEARYREACLKPFIQRIFDGKIKRTIYGKISEGFAGTWVRLGVVDLGKFLS